MPTLFMSSGVKSGVNASTSSVKFEDPRHNPNNASKSTLPSLVVKKNSGRMPCSLKNSSFRMTLFSVRMKG